jgi:nitrite reductase/ring-hydroxylating ferredoxin subunit
VGVDLAGSGVLGVTRAILVREQGVLRAFLNRCPHARWPLDTFDGRFLRSPDGALICAAHGALFDAVTGRCLGGPGRGEPLTVLELCDADGGIELYPPAAGASPAP